MDRLLSNQAIDPREIAARWVPEVVGSASGIQVGMDWTDFDADGQTTLAVNKVTPHGRATPLPWLTVMKDDLKNKRNAYEGAYLRKLAEVLPAGVKVTILADRGFGDTKLFGCLGTLGFDYVIRFRGSKHVMAATGERRPAADRVGKGGRAVKLSGAALTASEHPVGAVVCVKARDMKEPWCLATSLGDATSREIVDTYARRWTVEPSFRDTKDIRFGMGLSLLRISRPDRRDRLLLLNAFAIHLLTMPGTAGEELGMDRHLKSNTSKTRTHFLFRQGCMLYDLIPNLPEVGFRPLMLRFAQVIQRSGAIRRLVVVSRNKGIPELTLQSRDPLGARFIIQPQRSLDLDLAVTEVTGFEDPGYVRPFTSAVLHVVKDANDRVPRLVIYLATLRSQAAPQRLPEARAGSVDELDLPLAPCFLAVAEESHVGLNARVVEQVGRQADDGLQPIVLKDPPANLALAGTCTSCEKRRAVHDDADARSRFVVAHL